MQVALNDLKHSKASADALTKEKAALLAQQSHWNDLKRTAEHVEYLMKLLDNQAKQDVQEAQRLRDRTNVLEGELSALQKLHSDQMQRAAMSHEKKLKEREQELQNYTYKLEQSETSRKETTEELETLKAQLQEYEANLRVGQVSTFQGGCEQH